MISERCRRGWGWYTGSRAGRLKSRARLYLSWARTSPIDSNKGRDALGGHWARTSHSPSLGERDYGLSSPSSSFKSLCEFSVIYHYVKKQKETKRLTALCQPLSGKLFSTHCLTILFIVKDPL